MLNFNCHWPLIITTLLSAHGVAVFHDSRNEVSQIRTTELVNSFFLSVNCLPVISTLIPISPTHASCVYTIPRRNVQGYYSRMAFTPLGVGSLSQSGRMRSLYEEGLKALWSMQTG
jgi:hypothetical protein